MKRVIEQRLLNPYVGAIVEQDDHGAKLLRLVPHSAAVQQHGSVILSPVALDVLKAMLARNGL